MANRRTVYYRDIPPGSRELLWEMFDGALRPLKRAGKLGAIVFQFPPWFMSNRSSFRHKEECKERLPRHDIAVEFRNQYSLNEENFE